MGEGKEPQGPPPSPLPPRVQQVKDLQVELEEEEEGKEEEHPAGGGGG